MSSRRRRGDTSSGAGAGAGADAAPAPKRRRRGTPQPPEELERRRQRKEFAKNKLVELQATIDSINDGSHPNVAAKAEALEAQKAASLKKAGLLRDLKKKEIDQLYAWEEHAAQETRDNALRDVKQEAVAEVQREMRRMQDIVDGRKERVEPNTTRNLRSKAAKDGGDGANGVNGDGEPDAPSLELELDEGDVVGDLKSIHRDWQEVAQRFAASAAGAAAIRQVRKNTSKKPFCGPHTTTCALYHCYYNGRCSKAVWTRLSDPMLDAHGRLLFFLFLFFAPGDRRPRAPAVRRRRRVPARPRRRRDEQRARRLFAKLRTLQRASNAHRCMSHTATAWGSLTVA